MSDGEADVRVSAVLTDGLSSAGRVLLVLNRGGHRVFRLTFEPIDAGGGARIAVDLRTDDGGARLVREVGRIVSVVEVSAG